MATFHPRRYISRNPHRQFWLEDDSLLLSEEEEEDENEEEQHQSSDDGDDDDDDGGGGGGDDDDDDDGDDDVIISDGRSQTMADDMAEVSGDVDGGHIMTLSDPDVLDCPICIEPLTIPVFQCENGHIACSLCSPKVGNKCPSCALPIGYNRCRAMEKVIESVKISCRNSKYGCTETTKYSIKNEHENTCIYAPCSCPQKDCTFIGSSNELSAHFTSKHPTIATNFHFDNHFQILIDPNQEYVILQENEGQLFILNNIEYQSLGNIIFVSCIEPKASKVVFSYNVIAKKDGCVLKLECIADNVVKRAENPSYKRFLMVPKDFVDSCGKIKVELKILNRLPKTPTRGVTARFRFHK